MRARQSSVRARSTMQGGCMLSSARTTGARPARPAPPDSCTKPTRQLRQHEQLDVVEELLRRAADHLGRRFSLRSTHPFARSVPARSECELGNCQRIWACAAHKAGLRWVGQLGGGAQRRGGRVASPGGGCRRLRSRTTPAHASVSAAAPLGPPLPSLQDVKASGASFQRLWSGAQIGTHVYLR